MHLKFNFAVDLHVAAAAVLLGVHSSKLFTRRELTVKCVQLNGHVNTCQVRKMFHCSVGSAQDNSIAYLPLYHT